MVWWWSGWELSGGGGRGGSGPGKIVCAVRVGSKISRFSYSPDPLFVFLVSEVFRGIALVSARFHH